MEIEGLEGDQKVRPKLAYRNVWFNSTPSNHSSMFFVFLECGDSSPLCFSLSPLQKQKR
jgi:hypothetical protein